MAKGRNKLCECGSGKKYKRCCMKSGNPYKNGWDACALEQGLETNPYDKGTYKHREWLIGWGRYDRQHQKEFVYESVVTWPEGTLQRSGNVSTDAHHSAEAAHSVCRALTEQGMGLNGRIFPVKTEVRKIEKPRKQSVLPLLGAFVAMATQPPMEIRKENVPRWD